MGIDYLLVPANDEMLEYGRQSGVGLPQTVPHGRWPTVDELVVVLKSIPDHHITHINQVNGIDATIESSARVAMQPVFPFTATTAPASYLHVSGDLSGSEKPASLSFHGDADLMVSIVSRLSLFCGGLVFFATCDGLPWFVLPSSELPIGPEEWGVAK